MKENKSKIQKNDNIKDENVTLPKIKKPRYGTGNI